MDTFVFLALVFSFVGGINILVGIVFTKKYRIIKNDPYEIANADIIDIIRKVRRRNKGSSVSYYPILKFSYNGTEHTVKSEMAVKLRKPNGNKHFVAGDNLNFRSEYEFGVPEGNKFAIGDRISVRIYNHNPEKAIINSDTIIKNYAIASVIFRLLGTIFFVLGLVFFVLILI